MDNKELKEIGQAQVKVYERLYNLPKTDLAQPEPEEPAEQAFPNINFN